jgi:hypothetical protein
MALFHRELTPSGSPRCTSGAHGAIGLLCLTRALGCIRPREPFRAFAVPNLPPFADKVVFVDGPAQRKNREDNIQPQRRSLTGISFWTGRTATIVPMVSPANNYEKSFIREAPGLFAFLDLLLRRPRLS